MSSLNQVTSSYSWPFVPCVYSLHPIWCWKLALPPELTRCSYHYYFKSCWVVQWRLPSIAKVLSRQTVEHSSSPIASSFVSIWTCQCSSSCFSCVKLCETVNFQCQPQVDISHSASIYFLPVCKLQFKMHFLLIDFLGHTLIYCANSIGYLLWCPPDPCVSINRCLFTVHLWIYWVAVWAPAFPL